MKITRVSSLAEDTKHLDFQVKLTSLFSCCFIMRHLTAIGHPNQWPVHLKVNSPQDAFNFNMRVKINHNNHTFKAKSAGAKGPAKY